MTDLESLLAATDPDLGESWEVWDTVTRFALADLLEEAGATLAAEVRSHQPAARVMEFTVAPGETMVLRRLDLAAPPGGGIRTVRLVWRDGPKIYEVAVAPARAPEVVYPDMPYTGPRPLRLEVAFGDGPVHFRAIVRQLSPDGGPDYWLSPLAPLEAVLLSLGCARAAWRRSLFAQAARALDPCPFCGGTGPAPGRGLPAFTALPGLPR